MRISLLLLLLLFSAVPATPQDSSTPRVEVFGGYSLLDTPAGGSTQHGWNGAVTANLNRWFGITADTSAVYFDETYFYPGEGGLPDRTYRGYGTGYHFLFGPTFSLRRRRYTPFAHALLGMAHGTQHNILSVPGGSATFDATVNRFASAIGGGIDLTLTRNLAFRPVQADYVLEHWDGFTNNRFRYSTGLVFRF